MAVQDRELFTVRQVARACGCSGETVRRWIWDGKLPAHKLGNQLFVRAPYLAEFLSRNKRPVFRLPAAPKYTKAQLRELMERSRKLRERLFAKYGDFDVAAAVRQSREEH